jgi:hypothetical protein
MRSLHVVVAVLIVLWVGLIVWHTRDPEGWITPLPIKWIILAMLAGAYAMTEARP